jgi:hypothetical protein
MARYYTCPRAAPEGDCDDPLLPHIDVPEHKPVHTGLVDLRGDPIMRAPRPIGFGRDREWQ